MNSTEIADLLQPFLGPDSISSAQLAQTAVYLNVLLKWNAKINLTAIHAPQEIVTRHFGESFFAARHLLCGEVLPSSAIDIGSGAGFPGLPMKIWSPDLRLTLIESNGRKATFLRELTRVLQLSGVEVVSQRAEDVEAKAELVTLRAVERFESVLPVAEKLIHPRGTLGLLIGAAQEGTAKRLLPRFEWQGPKPIPLSQNRVLLAGVRS